MSEDSARSLLDDDQRRRAEAVREARQILSDRTGPFSSSSPDVVDMHTVAVFILDGGDPWTLPLEPVQGELIMSMPEKIGGSGVVQPGHRDMIVEHLARTTFEGSPLSSSGLSFDGLTESRRRYFTRAAERAVDLVLDGLAVCGVLEVAPDDEAAEDGPHEVPC